MTTMTLLYFGWLYAAPRLASFTLTPNMQRSFWITACILVPWLVLILHGYGLEAGIWLITLIVFIFSPFQNIATFIVFGMMGRGLQVYLAQHPQDKRRRKSLSSSHDDEN